MNNPEAFKEDEVRSIKFVVPGLPFGKQRPKVTVRKFTGSDGKEKKFAKAYTPEKTVNYENLVKMAYQEKAKGKHNYDDVSSGRGNCIDHQSCKSNRRYRGRDGR